MSGLSKKERLKILEMVSEIASEAAKNPNIISMVAFQQELVESLYHTMAVLVKHDKDDEDDDDEFVDFDDDEEREEEDENRKQDQLASARIQDEYNRPVR